MGELLATKNMVKIMTNPSVICMGATTGGGTGGKVPPPTFGGEKNNVFGPPNFWHAIISFVIDKLSLFFSFFIHNKLQIAQKNCALRANIFHYNRFI